jgi:hypothetical protein
MTSSSNATRAGGQQDSPIDSDMLDEWWRRATHTTDWDDTPVAALIVEVRRLRAYEPVASFRVQLAARAIDGLREAFHALDNLDSEEEKKRRARERCRDGDHSAGTCVGCRYMGHAG